jgi:hypothetical protein
MAASEPENSGGPPGASVVTAPRAPCAPSAAQVYRKKTSDKRRPALSYILGDGNEPPVMAAIHVKFVEMSAALLQKMVCMVDADSTRGAYQQYLWVQIRNSIPLLLR